MSEIKVSAGLPPSEDCEGERSRPLLQRLLFRQQFFVIPLLLLPHPDLYPHLHVVSPCCVQISLFYENISHIGLRAHPTAV